MARPESKVIIEPNITKMEWARGRATYAVGVKDANGQWFPRRSFQSLADARAYKRECLGKVAAGKSGKQVGSTLLFATAWNTWLNECRGSVSEGWQKDLRRFGERYFLPSFGHMALSQILPRDIGDLLEQLRAAGYAPQSVLHVYNALHKFFDDAVEHFEWVDVNPVRKRYRPKIFKKRTLSLAPTESVRLLAAAKGSFLEPAIYLGLLCGLRPCEIQALRWESVDMERGIIHIREAYKRKVRRIEPFPKQKEHGVCAIPSPMREYLESLPRTSNFVAPGPTGSMLVYETLLIELRKLCKKAEIPPIGAHGMRHSATELWVLNGANLEDCSRQLNHSSSAVTETYMHRTHGRLDGIAKEFRLPELKSSTPPPTDPQRPRLTVVR